MATERHIIVAVHVTERVHKAQDLQKVMSEYGCFIKTRLGLHETSENFCSANGIILLEMTGNIDKAREMQNKLAKIEGVEVKEIVFEHETRNII